MQTPHVDLADYRRLLGRLGRSHVRKRQFLLIGLPIGVLIGAVIGLTGAYGHFWAEGFVMAGRGVDGSLIALDGTSFWIALGALFIAGCILARIDGISTYRTLSRQMYESSRQNAPQSNVLIGDDGVQMIFNGIVWTIPWPAVSRIETGKTATFILFNGNLIGITLSNAAFASTDERTACLTFIQSKLPTRSGVTGLNGAHSA